MKSIKTGHHRESNGSKTGLRGPGNNGVGQVVLTICFLIIIIASSVFQLSCSNKESTAEILTGATLSSEDSKRLSDAHRPAFPFDKLPAPPAPDYAKESSWAALFPRSDEADVAPPNTLFPEAQVKAGIDVFFIHPTCYAKRDFWNGPIDDPDVKKAVSGIMMYQASVFNAGARVYAPRYRQFGLYSVLERQTTSGVQALEMAYSDVERAFDYYINKYNQDRPFILAGHSQGSIHGSRLLQKKIIGTPLQSRLVAAYLLGMTIPKDLSGIEPSKSATELGKVINWTSYTAEGNKTFLTEDVVIWVGNAYRKAKGIVSVQINPLSWTLNGGRVEAKNNPGSLPTDPSDKLPSLVKKVTGADASGKVLMVDKPAVPGFPGDGPDMPLLNADKGDFHNYDYQLFYESIRKNALDRAKAFLGKKYSIFVQSSESRNRPPSFSGIRNHPEKAFLVMLIFNVSQPCCRLHRKINLLSPN